MRRDGVLQAIGELLDRSHLASPDQLGVVVASAAERLGWTATVYLVDYEQEVLFPIPGGASDPAPEAVQTTMAGRAYRHVEPVPFVRDGEQHVWVTVMDGVERLGVVDIGLPEGADSNDEELLAHLRWFAQSTGHLLAGKGSHGDTYHRIRSRHARTVASELIWSLLPPLTTTCEGLVISAILEPAHSVAGDVFDYAIDGDLVNVAIVDATGHDLHSGVIGAVALAALRNARRLDGELEAMMAHVDANLARLGLDTYATGVFGRLDRSTGHFEYLNAGHPAPMLLRNGRVVKQLEEGRRTLFGLPPRRVEVAVERLEPGDWIIMYTDGVVEARDEHRAFFGIERFIDIIERCAADRRPAPETLRRIARAVLTHQHGVLQDDATMLIVQWGNEYESRMYAT